MVIYTWVVSEKNFFIWSSGDPKQGIVSFWPFPQIGCWFAMELWQGYPILWKLQQEYRPRNNFEEDPWNNTVYIVTPMMKEKRKFEVFYDVENPITPMLHLRSYLHLLNLNESNLCLHSRMPRVFAFFHPVLFWVCIFIPFNLSSKRQSSNLDTCRRNNLKLRIRK